MPFSPGANKKGVGHLPGGGVPPVKLAPGQLDQRANWGGGGNLTDTAEGTNFQTRIYMEREQLSEYSLGATYGVAT